MSEKDKAVPSFRTEVGNRLRELEKRFKNRAEAASAAGVAKSTLQSWIEGKADPSFEGLSRLAAKTGTSLDWLAGRNLGDIGGEESSPSSSTSGIQAEVFKEVSRAVARVHKEEGIKLPPDALSDELTRAYNALIERAEDAGDRDELLSLVPWLEARLRKRLREARAAPGGGKRRA
ncbi:helix-turn-helix domain-containing protein [Kaustia mangrovi]|uniref:Helix-turn-helix domain-containing protein n=1 Tax=Kaustia mangrovi TaxID=2593653 RepID=A0A7S8C750_9HYPH|nr:helix-turn-helix domain-containing protein [Kaustia mangrovi]QPC44597.1 helix-turn-helix domain-containing protein [Kaustia mangrovi]